MQHAACAALQPRSKECLAATSALFESHSLHAWNSKHPVHVVRVEVVVGCRRQPMHTPGLECAQKAQSGRHTDAEPSTSNDMLEADKYMVKCEAAVGQDWNSGLRPDHNWEASMLLLACVMHIMFM